MVPSDVCVVRLLVVPPWCPVAVIVWRWWLTLHGSAIFSPVARLMTVGLIVIVMSLLITKLSSLITITVVLLRCRDKCFEFGDIPDK